MTKRWRKPVPPSGVILRIKRGVWRGDYPMKLVYGGHEKGIDRWMAYAPGGMLAETEDVESTVAELPGGTEIAYAFELVASVAGGPPLLRTLEAPK